MRNEIIAIGLLWFTSLMMGFTFVTKFILYDMTPQPSGVLPVILSSMKNALPDYLVAIFEADHVLVLLANNALLVSVTLFVINIACGVWLHKIDSRNIINH